MITPGMIWALIGLMYWWVLLCRGNFPELVWEVKSWFDKKDGTLDTTLNAREEVVEGQAAAEVKQTRFIRLPVCGYNEHQKSLAGESEECSVKISGINYAISGCPLCIDLKIKELKGRQKKLDKI